MSDNLRLLFSFPLSPSLSLSLSYSFSPEDLWCSVGDVKDKRVSRFQIYNQLIVVIIVYHITFARECHEVLAEMGHTDIHGLKIS